jgi:polysaccharide pyruvyl transferase WcaK-like protein
VKTYSGKDVIFTDNIQTASEGLIDILKYYLSSKLVVTSRLHGAIISYSLGTPYISIARDKKIRSFVKDYGNGDIIEDIRDLKNHQLYTNVDRYTSSSIKIGDVLEFGKRASNYINDIC